LLWFGVILVMVWAAVVHIVVVWCDTSDGVGRSGTYCCGLL